MAPSPSFGGCSAADDAERSVRPNRPLASADSRARRSSTTAREMHGKVTGHDTMFFDYDETGIARCVTIGYLEQFD